MAAFKEQIDPSAVDRLARALHAVDAGIPTEDFVERAATGLDPLELKARVAHVAAALAATLPAPFEQASSLVRQAAALGRPWGGFDLWPVQHWVMTAGSEQPEVALPHIAALTEDFSGEFALRPFIDRYPTLTKAALLEWAEDDDEHVRRLASEGSRPRLPWGPRLAVAPDYGLDVLTRLHLDPSAYVRRSVANHLNDVCKDDPELALTTAARWAQADGEPVLPVLRHGLRTLVKAGHPVALALIGSDHAAEITVEAFTAEPSTVAIGNVVSMTLTLRSNEPAPTTVVVDYLVRFVNSRGGYNRRTFRWRTFELPAGGRTVLRTSHAFRDVSIRTHRPGTHHIDVQVNGRRVAEAAIVLVGGDL